MGQMGGMFGSPFGGMMGGYGSPFGGLGMFGMSPYGGMPNYGMFGGMMNPFMGGFGQRLPSGTRFPQIRKPVDRSTFVTDPTTYYKEMLLHQIFNLVWVINQHNNLSKT